MKKVSYIFAVVFAFMLIGSIGSNAADVNAEIVSFPVSINYELFDKEEYSDYPTFVYNDITYVPLTFYKANLLGIGVELTENGFFITDSPEKAPVLYQREPRHIENLWTPVKADMAPFKIKINNEDYTDEKYPFLFCRDIVYLPLTWNLTNDVFGWDFEFDGNQLTMFTNSYCYTSDEDSWVRYEDDGISYHQNEYFTYYKKDDVKIYLFTDTIRIWPMSRNLTITKGEEEKIIAGHSGYYQKAGPLFTVKDGYVYTVHYPGEDERETKKCKINIDTGEIVYLEE